MHLMVCACVFAIFASLWKVKWTAGEMKETQLHAHLIRPDFAWYMRIIGCWCMLETAWWLTKYDEVHINRLSPIVFRSKTCHISAKIIKVVLVANMSCVMTMLCVSVVYICSEKHTPECIFHAPYTPICMTLVFVIWCSHFLHSPKYWLYLKPILHWFLCHRIFIYYIILVFLQCSCRHSSVILCRRMYKVLPTLFLPSVFGTFIFSDGWLNLTQFLKTWAL